MSDKAKIQHFLLVFDHAQGELVETIEFGLNSEAAVAAYTECEERHRDNDLMDILLVGSDSLETVKATHANYFDGTAALARMLAKLLGTEAVH
jgi:hypothetical protein